MDRGKLIFRRTFTAHWGDRFLVSLLIFAGLFYVVMNSLILGLGFLHGFKPIILPFVAITFAIGGCLLYWGNTDRYWFRRMTFAIYDSGVLLPFPAKRTLRKIEPLFLPFEEIEAVYINEHVSRKADPQIVICLRGGRTHRLDYYMVGSISSLAQRLAGRARIYRDRDLILDVEVFHPPASLDVNESGVTITTRGDKTTVLFSDVMSLRGGEYWIFSLRDGRKIGFYPSDRSILRRIKALIRENLRSRSPRSW
ncbi:MAG: hypothetical protein ACE5QF_06400 [Thermoplasmata archaeon]